MTAMQMFQYDQAAGVKAGVSEYISESGAFVGKLSTKWTSGKNGSQSQALELSIVAPEGRANYLSIWYKKKDGQPNNSGVGMINAIMGILKLKTISQAQNGADYICPELEGKVIGLVLQKILQTKQDGSDTYKFDIKIPFHPETRKTLKELLENSPAATVDKMLETLHDKDERTPFKLMDASQYQQAGGGYNKMQATDDFDPFDEANY